jgi:CubicO group peptidase (beta-lactamase class C family)
MVIASQGPCHENVETDPMHRFLLTVAALVLLLPVCRAEEAKGAGAVRKVVERAVAGKRVAGAVYLVSQKGKVVFEGAVGLQDVDAGTPMKADTIFRIASMSKAITSVAALMLVEDGKLRLDDPLSKFVPEFKAPVVAVANQEDGKVVWTTVKAKREITVHDLLTHTSGISYRFFNRPYLGKRFVEAGVSDGLSETPGTIGDNVKRIARVPLFSQPGEVFEYGLNTDVLGRVIEVASGKTLAEFFHERLFEPLKMSDTGFQVPRDKRARLAALYEPGRDGGLVRIGTKPVTRGLLVYSATYPTAEDSRYYSGGAGLVSTAGDYHRFLRMLLQRGEVDGKRLLKAETVARMTRDQLGKVKMGGGVHGDRFGYGFGVETRREALLPAGSYSWGGLFYTFFWVDPKNEVCGVLMTQLFPADGVKLREEFVKAVYAGLGR